MEWAVKRGGIFIKKIGKTCQWQCAEGHVFNQTLNRVKFRGKWCPTCGTKGERKVREFFRKYNIPFVAQATFSEIPNRKYDFYFEWNNKRYLVEYDGEQHFRYVRKYHKTKQGFLESQRVDRVKTHFGLMIGCTVVRIDCTQEEWIHDHLMRALCCNTTLYLSYPERYKYLWTPMSREELSQYVPGLRL